MFRYFRFRCNDLRLAERFGWISLDSRYAGSAVSFGTMGPCALEESLPGKPKSCPGTVLGGMAVA